MKSKKIISVIFSILIAIMMNTFYSCFADENADAELLYTKINEFLSEHNDVDPEKFDDVCKKYMDGEIPKENLLSKQEFDKKSKYNIILFRGISDKKYADEFKQGKIFLSCWNVRGSGIYTSTSLDCAKDFIDHQNPDDGIVEMFIPRDKVRILHYKYLEKLQKIITKSHSEEFGEFEFKDQLDKKRKDYIFDSLSDYGDKIFAKCIKEATKKRLSDAEAFNLFKETKKKLEKDPDYQKRCRERKRYFKSNKAYVWFNSGLLAKLMRYDVLYSFDSLRESSKDKEEEYLIVNPNILYVLAT